MKRFLSAILVVCMLCALLPAGVGTALAAKETEATYQATEEDNDFDSTAAVTDAAIASGSCGESLTWTLDDGGTLTISGAGEMENWRFGESYAPWHPFHDRIRSAVLPDGVTSIGGAAFAECAALTSVTIPDSVTSIGDYAFYGCAGLTDITIPDSVTTLNSGTFQNCTGLTRVRLPDGLTGR